MNRPDDDREPVRGTIDDELVHHFESRVQELVARGWSRHEAEREARDRLGDIAGIKRQVERQHRSTRRRNRLVCWAEDLRQDLVVGVRRLSRSPAFMLVATLTLALGIGANSALFSVIHKVVLQPLPFSHPERLVRVWESAPGRGWDFFEMSGPNFVDYRVAALGRVDLAAIGLAGFNLTGGDLPERIDAYRISANLTSALGVEPLHGRGFAPEEDAPGAPARVTLLGYDLWQRRFGGDPGIVGSSLRLDDAEYRVLGVLPRLAPLVVDDALFVPLAADPASNRSHHDLMAIARIAGAGAPEDVERELDAIASRLAADYPDSNEGFDTQVTSLYDALIPEETRLALYVLLGAVGLVLLIACANLSNLMLARVTSRQRELAIYGALGASRGRVVRQLVTESLLVSALGALVGVALALRATSMIRELRISGIPRIDEVAIDPPVLAFTAAVAVAAGLLAGLFPAAQATGDRLPELLADGGRGATGSRRTHRFRAALMVVEVALAVVLLAGAGLLLRSFQAVRGQDPGLDVDRVLTMELSVPVESEEELGGRVTAYRELLAALEGLPGIDRAAAVSALPFGPGATVMDFLVEGSDIDPSGGVPSAGWRLVTPGYFDAVGIELLAGRNFDDGDDLSASSVAIISRRMAERYWPDVDPVGRVFLGWRDRPLTVIGVAENVRERSLEADAQNLVYLPYYGNPWWSDMFLVTRTPGDPTALTGAIRATLAQVLPGVPVAFVRPMEEVLADSLAPRRFSTSLLTAFALLALALSAAGVYGVVSYGVARRRAEIGVRMALGARARQVVQLMVRQGMLAVAMGGAIGLFGALLATRLLASQLYGIQARDPLTFGVATAFLALVGLTACALPALRAASVDPIDTLREG